MKEDEKNLPIEDSWWLRNIIAIIITSAVIAMTIAIAIVILCNPKTKGEVDLEFIGQSLLPLWGTWIGTVLAFYFGKSNFEAASQSYQKVINSLTTDEKIAKLKVKDVMVPVKKLERLDFDTEKDNLISKILEYENFKQYNRFAVFSKGDILKCIIHRSTFHEFIVLKYNEYKTADKVDALTLKDILESTDYKIKNSLTRGFGLVAIDASLYDAKKVMDSIAECLDVFITQTGSASEPVLGLVTNNMILDKAKV